ncbi:unnamed protein product [Linum trigynum]|uniref:Uncharacterized protein n=1 Tax=Linum trigynum TaxID=586398 RepID=A0AAV2FCQ7_9ROSI
MAELRVADPSRLHRRRGLTQIRKFSRVLRNLLLLEEIPSPPSLLLCVQICSYRSSLSSDAHNVNPVPYRPVFL